MQISEQLTFCTWIYPRWSRWYPRIGVFEIKTSETPRYIEKQIHFDLRLSKKGSDLNIRAMDVQTFHVNDSIPYVNILRLVSLFRITTQRAYSCWNKMLSIF